MFCDHTSCNGGLFYVVGIIVKYRDCFQAQNMNHKLGWTLDVIMMIQQRSVVLGLQMRDEELGQTGDGPFDTWTLPSRVEKYFDSKP